MKHDFQQLAAENLLSPYSREVQSKVVLGAAKLSEADFATARTLFEQSIALDHKCGVAWLGKAHAEAVLNFVNDQNCIPAVDLSLQTARRCVPDGELFPTQQASVLETLVRRITDELLLKLKIVKESQARAEKARNEAVISALVTIVAAEIGSHSKSATGKVLGYGTAAAAGANTVSSLNNAGNLAVLSASVFGVLLTQCYLSAPVLKSANELKDHLPEPSRKSMEEAINQWTAAAADCFNLQLSRLSTTLSELKTKVSGTDALKATGELDEGFQANYAELSALRLSAQMFGLNEHSSCAKLDGFLTALQATLQSEEAKRDFKTAKIRRIIAISVSAGLALTSCVTFCNTCDYEQNSVPLIAGFGFIISCLACGVCRRFKWLFKGTTQKRLTALTKEFKAYVQTIRVSADDVVVTHIKGNAGAIYGGFAALPSEIPTGA